MTGESVPTREKKKANVKEWLSLLVKGKSNRRHRRVRENQNVTPLAKGREYEATVHT